MAQADPTGSVTASGWGEGRERGTRRKKVYGYIKAANELRQSYQSQWAQSRNQDEFEDEQGIPGAFPDVEIVRSCHEEMVLFPSYARNHIKDPKAAQYDKPGAHEDIAHPASSGDAEYWKRQWEKYEDDNAIVDIDVRGWIYTPHQGAITRKNRLVIAVARKLSGIPAPASDSGSSRDSSRHSVHREKLEEWSARHEEEAAAREAQSIVQRGEGEADAAWRGTYSEDPSRTFDARSPYSTRSSSPLRHQESSDEPFPGRLRHARTDSSLNSESEDPGTKSLAKPNSWNRPANMSKEELARANALLMARLKPFMHLPLASAPITVFFFNDQKSQSRSVNTNESGHFTLRASLDFVPTSIRVLASENLSATEKVTISDSRGVSLISDIDDTIKHSAIAGGAKEIFFNTFIRELGDLTIKGVKEWYSKLAALGVQLHYVSNSPWQLYPLLRSYFALAGLPPGSFHLKQYSGMLQGIFEPAAERKKSSLDKIMRDFPQRRFILVGDSGEADLEVYTDVVTANPGRVLGVFIRDVTTPEKEFFDQSPDHPRGGHHTPKENDTRRGGVGQQSDVPDTRPPLPSRTTGPGPRTEQKEHPVGDLIDFDEDVKENSEKEASHRTYLRELEKNSQRSPRSPPPNRPSKPPSLRSTSNTQTQPTDHERSISTTSSPTSPPTAQAPSRNAGPPPKPRRPSTSINLPKDQRAPFSSSRQNLSRAQPLNSPSPYKPRQHAQEEEEGYATSARRHVVSAYNTLPSPRTLWSGSPHAANSPSATPTQEQPNPISNHSDSLAPPSRLSTRRNISTAAHTFASNRLSWGAAAATGASAGDPAAGGNGGAPPGSTYNKKEEVWRRRWARAEELMRREGVVLRTWRVGGDVMEECVGICERAMREMGEGER